MKYLFSLLIVTGFTLTPSISSAQNRNNPLIGTWQLIRSAGMHDGGAIDTDSSKVYMIKTVTPNRFVFTTYRKGVDTLLMSAEGAVTISGNRYSETILHSTIKPVTGLTFNYNSTVSGDTWKIEGGGNGLKLAEEWVRLK